MKKKLTLPGSLQGASAVHSSFSDRLKFLIGDESERAFASRLGLTGGAVRGWMNRSEPSRAALVKICHECDVGIAWLTTGEGPMRLGEEVLPPPAWEQEKAELEEKMRDYRRLQEHLEAGKREIELLKEVAEANRQIRNMEKGMVKQPPPPPTAGGGVADITLLGLAECGMAGWLLKKPLSVNVICPVGMNPAEDFAVMATGQSLFYAGIEPGFVCFCATKSTPRVGDIVYVLKPNNMASLGVVRELEHKKKGSKTPWLVLQKWHDLDPKTGLREPYTLRENRDEIVEVVPVIYVQRRPI